MATNSGTTITTAVVANGGTEGVTTGPPSATVHAARAAAARRTALLASLLPARIEFEERRVKHRWLFVRPLELCLKCWYKPSLSQQPGRASPRGGPAGHGEAIRSAAPVARRFGGPCRSETRSSTHRQRCMIEPDAPVPVHSLYAPLLAAIPWVQAAVQPN